MDAFGKLTPFGWPLGLFVSFWGIIFGRHAFCEQFLQGLANLLEGCWEGLGTLCFDFSAKSLVLIDVLTSLRVAHSRMLFWKMGRQVAH